METYSIRLLRRGTQIKDVFTKNMKSKLIESTWFGDSNIVTFCGSIYAKSPGWRKTFEEGCDSLPVDFLNQGIGSIIFFPVEDRYMAVCFGYIHCILDDNAFESHFGLKVTLNTVPRDRLRTIEVATPDAILLRKRTHASKDSDLHQFGVDISRDLAYGASGTPRENSFARFVEGKDALSITCDANASDLHLKCHDIYAKYNEKTYLNDYAWIDNLRFVTDSDVRAKLDEKLYKELHDLINGEVSHLHLDTPTSIEYPSLISLNYKGIGGRSGEYTSLSIDDYVYELRRYGCNEGIEHIKTKHKIEVNDDSYKKNFCVYKCFVFETSFESHEYVLFEGTWYVTDRKFKDEVETYFQEIPKIEVIGETHCHNEEALIAHLESRNDLIKFDCMKFNPSGVKNANFEICDFFSRENQFIHLKDGCSSSNISHLWFQGLVSAEAFLGDDKYRREFRKSVTFDQPYVIDFSEQEIKDRSKFTVVFGIMRKPYKNGEVGLPFFSKVSFRTAAQKIRNHGMKVAVEIILKKCK